MTASLIGSEPLRIGSGDETWALETRDLTIAYGDFVAAKGVTLRVASGEIYGLLGPNGAGKTSVIRALTTIVPIAGGTATVDGNPLNNPIAVRSSIGVLPESNGYPGAQTGRSYLRYYGQLFGLTPSMAEERAERLLAQLGLGENYGRIATFSRGMRQRLGLARALINEPAVLRVAADAISAADTALREASAASALRFDNTRPGDIGFRLSSDAGSSTRLLQGLLNAGIEVLSFDLQGARLSDAFLALTGGAANQGTNQGQSTPEKTS